MVSTMQTVHSNLWPFVALVLMEAGPFNGDFRLFGKWIRSYLATKRVNEGDDGTFFITGHGFHA